MPKPDHDMMMRLIREHFNEGTQAVLTFTRWKDGIDIEYPTAGIELFYEAVRKEVIRECADLVATDLSDCSGQFIAEQLRDLSFQPIT